MAIEISEFADAVISISPTGVVLDDFGVLGFVTSESGILPVQRGKKYSSLTEVGEDFNSSTQVYLAATAFYAQTPRPKYFTAISVYEADQSAMVLGGGHATTAELVTITSGILDVVIDGAPFSIAVDFTGITNEADVVNLINIELVAGAVPAVISYTGTSYLLTNSTSGVASTTEYVTGDLAVFLGLEQHQATLSQGFAGETPVAALLDAKDKTIEFTAVVTHKKYRDSIALVTGFNTEDIADWCEANRVIFMNTTNNLSSLDSAVATDIGSILKLKGLRYTLTNFSKNINQYVSASVFARAATVNFEGTNTTITLNLKQAPTITAEELNTSELAALRDKRINVVVVIGRDAIGYTESRMANGSWLDTVHGLMWLENRIEVDLFNLLYTTNTKIPYTTLGLNMTEAQLERSLQAAVRNGLAAPGFLPDGTYLPEGYLITKIPLSQVSASDKTNRIYRGLGFKLVGAGALHTVLVTGEFSE